MIQKGAHTIVRQRQNYLFYFLKDDTFLFYVCLI